MVRGSHDGSQGRVHLSEMPPSYDAFQQGINNENPMGSRSSMSQEASPPPIRYVCGNSAEWVFFSECS